MWIDDFDQISRFRSSDCVLFAGVLALVFQSRLRRSIGLFQDLRDPGARLENSEMRELASAALVGGIILGLLIAAAGLWITGS